MSQKIIYTLGYEKLTLFDFIRIVKDNKIVKVVDIRAQNMVTEGRGRFTPEQLSQILENVNVDYVHLHEVGIPIELQPTPGGNGHSADFRNEYKSILNKNRKIKNKIREIFTEGNILVLAYLEDINRSHRLPFSELASSFLGSEYTFQHLTSNDLKPIEIPPPESYK